MNRTNFKQKNRETEKEICAENTKNKQNVSVEKNPVTMRPQNTEKPLLPPAPSPFQRQLPLTA